MKTSGIFWLIIVLCIHYLAYTFGIWYFIGTYLLWYIIAVIIHINIKHLNITDSDKNDEIKLFKEYSYLFTTLHLFVFLFLISFGNLLKLFYNSVLKIGKYIYKFNNKLDKFKIKDIKNNKLLLKTGENFNNLKFFNKKKLKSFTKFKNDINK